jgi:hypothetical protein
MPGKLLAGKRPKAAQEPHGRAGIVICNIDRADAWTIIVAIPPPRCARYRKPPSCFQIKPFPLQSTMQYRVFACIKMKKCAYGQTEGMAPPSNAAGTGEPPERAGHFPAHVSEQA